MDRAVLLWVVAHRTGWGTALARGLMAMGTRARPLAAAGLAFLLLLAAVGVLVTTAVRGGT